MRYTVTWDRDAEDELARIWLDTGDRAAVTSAADRIDHILRDDPDVEGEEFHGDRILIVPPLAVIFAVITDDRIVKVLQVVHR